VEKKVIIINFLGMAIIKIAKNITIKIKNRHFIYAGEINNIADKISIVSTKENLSFNSNKKIVSNGIEKGIVHGNYEAPEEKTITNVVWLDSENKQIDTAKRGDLLTLKVSTKNYDVGEVVYLTVAEDGENNIQLMGFVDANNEAILQEITYYDKLTHLNSQLA